MVFYYVTGHSYLYMKAAQLTVSFELKGVPHSECLVLQLFEL